MEEGMVIRGLHTGMFTEQNFSTFLENPRYPLIKNSIVVVIFVTSIALAISIKVFLSRVGQVWTVILKICAVFSDIMSLF